MSENMVNTLREGLRNEFDGAVNYLLFAAKTGDVNLREKMLVYAKNEIEHALKLLDLLKKMGLEVGDVSPEPVNFDDLIEFMINYQAKEEAAVYYYNLLANLLEDPHAQEVFKKIADEESEHYKYIKDLLQKIYKSGDIFEK
ncbi:MAG: ferritin-like domain-containing protein [Clostridia bacterium]|nr:ferritin-like domain-containing protein [Clostridia bacterium]